MMRWHKVCCLCGKWILQVDLFRSCNRARARAHPHTNNKSNCEAVCCDMRWNGRVREAFLQWSSAGAWIAIFPQKHCVNLRLQPYLCKIYLKWYKKGTQRNAEREREQSEKTMTAALSSIVCFFNIANKRGERAECKIASMQNATQLAKTFGGYAATSKYNMKIFIYIKSVAEIRIENFLRWRIARPMLMLVHVFCFSPIFCSLSFGIFGQYVFVSRFYRRIRYDFTCCPSKYPEPFSVFNSREVLSWYLIIDIIRLSLSISVLGGSICFTHFILLLSLYFFTVLRFGSKSVHGSS